MVVFRSAADAQAVGAPIIRMFATGFGRMPDPPELLELVAAIRAGIPLGAMADRLVAGPEFLARHGPDGPPNPHFVRALFWAIDGEATADEDCARLLAPPGASRAGVLLAGEPVVAGRGAAFRAGGEPVPRRPASGGRRRLPTVAGMRTGPPAGALAAIARHAGTPGDRALDLARFSLVPDTCLPARPDLVEESVAALSAQIYGRTLGVPAGLRCRPCRRMSRAAVQSPGRTGGRGCG